MHLFDAEARAFYFKKSARISPKIREQYLIR
jgi:hypothetical protein